MRSTSSYGENSTCVFYISVCLNGRAGIQTSYFRFKERAAKAMMKNCPSIKQHCKDRDNFRNCKLFFIFFFSLSDNPQGKMLAL